MTLKKILVPIDFSEYSDKALEYALFLAEKFHSQITLFHMVLEFDESLVQHEIIESYEKIIVWNENDKTKQLKNFIKKTEKTGIHMDSILFRGVNVANTIIDLLNQKEFDLIIMGTHGHTGLRRWFLGSNAEKVVQLSPIPVITIHKDFKKIKIKRILVPVDFSKYSKTAIDRSISIAQEFKSKIEFLHVVEMEEHPEFYKISFKSILQTNPRLKRYIVKNLKELTGKSIIKANYTVLEGKVYKEIQKYAQKKHIDLIIMPAHGMSKWEHFIIGSNTERVARVASCPVLTIRKY